MAAARDLPASAARLEQLVITAAERALAFQDADGRLPAGHNGPYRDPETPVRNTAHWAITFLTAWERTGRQDFRTAAERAVAYLCAPEARPGDGVFYCRASPGKDRTNGLIGQAWAIEALTEAGVRLCRPELLRLATRVFLLHPYERREGGWRRVALSGDVAGFDRTFNHQLWFCAAGAALMSAGEHGPASAVDDFLARLPRQLSLYPAGLIRHASGSFLAAGPRGRVLGAARSLRYAWRGRALHDKSIGYHAFNTYALAMIERALPNLRLSAQPRVAKALAYLQSPDYAVAIDHNAFGFPYNPPGFECAVTLSTFLPGLPALADGWLERQYAATYNPATRQMDRNVADAATSAARLYEACRLL